MKSVWGLDYCRPCQHRFQPLSKCSFEALGYRLLSLGEDMQRREFITLLGGAAAWPGSAQAQQQAERKRSIGVLLPLVEDDHYARAEVAAFVTALQQAGWADGRN